MVNRPILVAAVLTTTALVSTGCVSFQWEQREKRNPDGFSVETAPPAQALEDAEGELTASPPTRPVAPIVLRTDTSIAVSWNAPNDSGGSPVSYQTRISQPDEVNKFRKWSKPNRKKKKVFTASPSARYRVKVRAVNEAGKSKVVQVTASPIRSQFEPPPSLNSTPLDSGTSDY